MSPRKCKVSQLVKHALQLVLLAAWLSLTGLQITHFLSEPTAVQSRLDHKFKPPFITVIPIRPMPKRITRILEKGTEEERSELLANQTLIEFIRAHSLSLAEFSGVANVTDERRQQDKNETTLKDFSGTWKLTTYRSTQISATLNLSGSAVVLTLPRNTDLVKGIGSNETIHYLYWIVFHSENNFWRFDTELHTYLPVKNASHHQDIKVAVEREVDLNLRRQPCVEDPAYFITECQRKCFLNRVNCSLGNMDRGETSMKPLCTASEYPSYVKGVHEFFYGNNETEEAPVSKCDCPTPCVTDRISYTTLSDITKSTNDSLKVYISMSRVRRTRETVLTYELEDLLADIGGYLGLLLGVSLLSLCGAGQRLAGRLVGRVKRCRRSRRAAREKAAGDGAERAWSLAKEEAPSVPRNGSPEHDGWSRHIDISLDNLN